MRYDISFQEMAELAKEQLAKQGPVTIEQARLQAFRLKLISSSYPDIEKMRVQWWYPPLDYDYTLALTMKRHSKKATLPRYKKYLRKFAEVGQQLLLLDDTDTFKMNKLIRLGQCYAWVVRDIEWKLRSKGIIPTS